MGKNAVNIGQHYFHNEDLSEAKVQVCNQVFLSQVCELETNRFTLMCVN